MNCQWKISCNNGFDIFIHGVYLRLILHEIAAGLHAISNINTKLTQVQ